MMYSSVDEDCPENESLLPKIYEKLNFYNGILIIASVTLVTYLFSMSYQEKMIEKGHQGFTLQVDIDSNDTKSLLMSGNTVVDPFQLVQPFQHFAGQEYKVVPNLSLAVCEIQKVMSLLMTSIFCYLYDTEAFVKANRTIAKEPYKGRFCEGKNEYNGYSEVAAALGNVNFTKIALIRDPIDRFVSGFVDKCVNEVQHGATWNCHGCKGDLKCFLENHYKQLMNCTDCSGYNYEIAHFAPQNWYCEFKTYHDEYHIIRYSHKQQDKQQIADQLTEILKQKNVSSEKIDTIRNNILMKSSTMHVTEGSNSVAETHEKLINDPYLLSIFTSIYYYDYFLFKFDLPMNLADIVNVKHLLNPVANNNGTLAVKL